MEDDSTEFSDSIPQIIAQSEEMIFQRLPNLPCFRQKTTANFVIGTSEYTVANARMIRQVCFTNSGNKVYIEQRVDSYLRDYWPNSATTSTPRMYAIKSSGTSGTVIIVAPTPDSTYAYEVDFIAKITGLSSSNSNNWIGDNAENVLLAASLYESSAFLKASETLNFYKQQFDEAVALYQQEMARNYTAEYSGGI